MLHKVIISVLVTEHVAAVRMFGRNLSFKEDEKLVVYKVSRGNNNGSPRTAASKLGDILKNVKEFFTNNSPTVATAMKIPETTQTAPPNAHTEFVATDNGVRQPHTSSVPRLTPEEYEEYCTKRDRIVKACAGKRHMAEKLLGQLRQRYNA